MAAKKNKNTICTIVVFNDNKLVVRRADESCAVRYCEDLRSMLHDDLDDVRWNIISANVEVDVDEC